MTYSTSTFDASNVDQIRLSINAWDDVNAATLAVEEILYDLVFRASAFPR